jgi:hypothetical protein
VNVFTNLPPNTLITINFSIDSQRFNLMSNDQKKYILTCLLKLKDIDNRIPIELEDINVIGDYSRFRYKSREKPVLSSSANGGVYYPDSYSSFSNIDPFSLIRFRQVNNEEDNSVLINPCFNKGYYNKELNFTGIGDYDQCYSFITDELNQNKTILKDYIYNTVNNTLNLDSQFKQFKFLFYEKYGENIYKYKENITYGGLKEKIRTLCNKQYSYIIVEYAHLHVNNLSKMCFEATYLTILFDKYGIIPSTQIKMPTHSKRPTVGNIVDNFQTTSQPYNIIAIILMLISLFTSILLFYVNEPVAKFFNENILNKLLDKDDEFDLDTALQFPRVKAYLFYDDNAIFKTKYGKDFEPENYDLIIIKNTISELITKDEELVAIIHECEGEVRSMKSYLAVSLVQILLLLMFLVNFCICLNNLAIDYAFVKIIVTVCSLIFVVLVVMISLRTLIRIEKTEK